MHEYDYEGDMSYYQDQLAAKGITKKMLNMDNFAGLSVVELQSIVDGATFIRKCNACIVN